MENQTTNTETQEATEVEQLTLTRVIDFLETANVDNRGQFVLFIENEEMTSPELIINNISELEYKINFLKNSYNEDCTHKNTSKIKIINAVFTDIIQTTQS